MTATHFNKMREVSCDNFCFVTVFTLFAIVFQGLLIVYNVQAQDGGEALVAKKQVLFWTDFPSKRSDHRYWPYLEKSIDSMFKYCPVDNCRATMNRTLVPVENFAAIVFNGAEYSPEFHGIPEGRSPEQRYVYLNVEPPTSDPKTPNLASFNNFYNWTMTYRTNSYIPMPHGRIEEQEMDLDPLDTNDLLSKPKILAVFRSGCVLNNRTEKLLRKLKKHLAFDMYTDCTGNDNSLLTTQCPSNIYDCYREIEDRYKFVLPLEEVNCQDYVTEAFYEMLQKNVVLLRYSGGSSHNLILPKESVIDVDKFPSAAVLAKYLFYLSQHPKQYLRYFDWKKHYAVQVKSDVWWQSFCDLCQKLNNPFEPPLAYSYIREWWWGDNEAICVLK